MDVLKSGSGKKSNLCNHSTKPFLEFESTIKPCETYSKDAISKTIFRGAEMKKSEIRLNSENVYPYVLSCLLTLPLLRYDKGISYSIS